MATPKAPESVKMEGVTLVFRNFEGREERFNQAGNRNFGVLLDDDVAKAMEADGWAIKWLKAREEDEDGEEQAWLKVKLSYKGRPPTVAVITSRGRLNLKEDAVETLDWADIKTVDLIVNPYAYEIQATGKSGISAYVKSLFAIIEEDELEAKYAELPVQ